MVRSSLICPIVLLVCVSIALPKIVAAQGTPVTSGPLSVTIPPGWTLQGQSSPPRYFSPESTLQQYFALDVFPPQTINDDVIAHHNGVINNLSGLAAPGTQTQSGILGSFVWTRIEIRPPGSSTNETIVLYSAKIGSTYVALDADTTSPGLLAKDLPIVENMIRAAILNDAAAAQLNSQQAPPYGSKGFGAQPQQQAPYSAQPQSGLGAAPQQNGFGGAQSSASYGQQQQIPTGLTSLAQYQYTPPQGWTPHQYPDGITLTAPTSNTGENCQISMWPMRASTGNLQSDADAAFREVFKAFEPRTQTSYGDQVQTVEARGTSGQGWDYLVEKRGIGLPRTAQQTFETLQGFVFVANLNGTVAVVSGISKPPLVSACFGELLNDVWPDFFYNLKFRSWTPVDTSSALIQQLVGTWNVATATVADQFTFTADGRYGGASAAQQYNLAGNGTVLTTTQGYFGDGSYTVNGNAMVMTHDNQSRPPTNAFFRIEQETKDGRTWTPLLYLQRISTVDGKEYEVKYKKTR